VKLIETFNFPMADRLISAFPNEISITILPQLPFYNLLRGQRVSGLWKEFVDGNSDISQTLFLFPPHLRNRDDSAARQEYVDRLWELLNRRKMPNTTSVLR
jgi:hypothetical protein